MVYQSKTNNKSYDFGTSFLPGKGENDRIREAVIKISLDKIRQAETDDQRERQPEIVGENRLE